jgi:hypothetical protein
MTTPLWGSPQVIPSPPPKHLNSTIRGSWNNLEVAKQSLLVYTMNEDNIFYVNYPHQITLNDISEVEQ